MRRWLPLALLSLAVPPPACAQDYACAVPATIQAPVAPPEIAQLRQFATGAGVRVAVIDTGIAPNPELDQLRPVRDFVADDPLLDCDSHGTVVAGIIGGTTLGIAPAAEILSIRQTSAHYRSAGGAGGGAGDGGDAAAGNLQTLTDAINTAVDEGARIINISIVSCVDPGIASRIDDSGLAAALDRAERSGTVVVAAAGNAGQGCEPGFTVFPANYPTVLAVAARQDAHTLAQYSLDAPLSAQGTVPAALASSGGGWASGTMHDKDVVAYSGTSFAAPVVTGAVALLIERNPELSPKLIRERVRAAAQPGGGAVDPLAVVTQLQPEEVPARGALTVQAVDADTSQAPARLRAVVLALLAALAAASVALSRRGTRR